MNRARLGFLVFGLGSYNIVMLFSANATLIANYGWQALMDGAALQFVELIVSGYLSMSAYVIFKVCEHKLAHDLAAAPAGQSTGKAAIKPEANGPGE